MNKNIQYQNIFLATSIGVFGGWQAFYCLHERFLVNFWSSAIVGVIISILLACFLVDTHEIWHGMLTAWHQCVSGAKARVQWLTLALRCEKKNIWLNINHVKAFLKKVLPWTCIIVANMIWLSLIGMVIIAMSGDFFSGGKVTLNECIDISILSTGVGVAFLWLMIVLSVSTSKINPLQIPSRIDYYALNKFFNVNEEERSSSFSFIEKLFFVVSLIELLTLYVLYIHCTLIIFAIAMAIEAPVAIFNVYTTLATSARLSTAIGATIGYTITFAWSTPSPWQIGICMLTGGIVAIVLYSIHQQRLLSLAKTDVMRIHLGFVKACLR